MAARDRLRFAAARPPQATATTRTRRTPCRLPLEATRQPAKLSGQAASSPVLLDPAWSDPRAAIAGELDNRPVDCPGSLDVVHTPLQREDIPEELIQGLQEQGVRYIQAY